MVRKYLDVYPRRTGVLRRRTQWGWRLLVAGRVVATDGGQGYENAPVCESEARDVIGGTHGDAVVRRP